MTRPGAAVTGSTPSPAQLRVLSYNVRSLRDDPAAVARVIRYCQPDVACLQEAPRWLRWRSRRAALARTSGLLAGNPEGRPGGVTVLTAQRVRVWQQRWMPLSATPRRHRRALATVVIELGGARWIVGAVHLGLDAAERRRHVAEILGSVSVDEPPLVLAGDVNETPGEPAYAALAARLQDCFAVAGAGAGETFPARRPSRRIDAVFADPRLSVVSCVVPDLPDVPVASDHRPVLAVLAADPGGVTASR